MRGRTSRPGRRSAGFTLIEILIGLGAFASLLVVVLGVEHSALRGIRANDGAAEPVERASRLAERIDRELRMAGFLSLLVPGPLGLEAPVDGGTYSELHFRRVVGFTTAGVVYGPEVTFRRVLDPGENANGTDDDGDGLTDEGVFLLETQGGISAPIASGVTQFSVHLDGRSLDLTIESGIPQPGGEARSQAVVRTVTLRND